MTKFNKETGEITDQLNVLIKKETKRSNGSLRVQLDFSNCPSMAEQHTAHLTDINYLMKKLQPDELASYVAARAQYKNEILGHDFSEEPNFQEAKNVVYKLRKAFEELPDDLKMQFKNHVEFLKFVDNPSNQEKLIKMGIMTKKEIQKHTEPKNDDLNDDKKANPEISLKTKT